MKNSKISDTEKSNKNNDVNVRVITNQERFQKFRSWWKLEDKSWVEQRKKEWQHIRSNSMKKEGAKDLKDYGRFYLLGEEPQNDNMGRRSIHSVMRIVLTPFDTEKQASDLYFTIPARERSWQIVQSILGSICTFGQGTSWMQQKVKVCARVIYGNEYRLRQEPSDERNPHPIITSPEPTEFASSFCWQALRILQGRSEYNPSVELVDYFVSALAHANKPSYRPDIKLTQLLQMVDEVLNNKSNHSDVSYALASDIKEKEALIRKNWEIHADMDK